MTWDEIADEQRRAAQELIAKKNSCPRASCSRSYYAAYALVAGKVPASMVLAYVNNPGHNQLLGIVDQLRGVPKRQVKLALRRLRLSRVTADYGVGINVSNSEAKQRLRDCAYVFRELAGR